jgi:hypothetical protein
VDLAGEPEPVAVLLYLLTFVLLAGVPHATRNARWLIRGLALVLTVLSVAGLVSRVSPALIGAPLSAQVEDRLSWPVGAESDALTEGFAPEGASSRNSGSVLALQLALACAAAGLARLLAATAERRLPVTRARPWSRRTVVIVVAAACAGGMALALAAGAAENLEDH